jgi:lysophospholipase L1-like esterase
MYGIITFGDSITFGCGESPCRGWSNRLKEHFEQLADYNFLFNQGIPGATTTSLLRHLEAEANARIRYIYPDDKHLIIIAIGINDSREVGAPKRMETAADVFRDNMQKIIAIARRFTEHIVIVGLTPVDESLTNDYEETYFTNERIREYEAILQATAKEHQLLFIDMFNHMSGLEYEKMLEDGLHPNSDGYDEMYKIIKDSLEKKSFL